MHDNRLVKRYLNQQVTLRNCPGFVDDALNGCAHPQIEGANKPLSVRSLFFWLKRLDEISTESIMLITGYSKRYCQQLMTCLRVASKHIEWQLSKLKITPENCCDEDILCLIGEDAIE